MQITGDPRGGRVTRCKEPKSLDDHMEESSPTDLNARPRP